MRSKTSARDLLLALAICRSWFAHQLVAIRPFSMPMWHPTSCGGNQSCSKYVGARTAVICLHQKHYLLPTCPLSILSLDLRKIIASQNRFCTRLS